MFLIDFIKSAFEFRKYQKILKKVYRDEHFIDNMNDTFGIEFNKDYFGRLYTIINPYIKNEKVDFKDLIYDVNEGKLSLDTYTEKYIMDILNIVKLQIKEQRLFDMLTYKLIRKEGGNYLLILEPIPFEDFKNSLNNFLVFLIILNILLTIGYTIYKYI